MSVRNISQDHHSTRQFSQSPFSPTSFAKTKLTTLVLLALAAVQPMLASAEDTADNKAKNAKDEQVEKIQVTGIRSSIKESLFLKQNATSVVDVVVAEDIGKFPDENLAEALQRIPGITITRNGGEGQNVVIRGLGAGYNITTLNGRKLASENSGRDFNYDTIASELVSTIAVYKSPEARLQEGGIGAVVDIQTRKPLDLKGFTMAASAKGVYEERTGDTQPHVSFLVGDLFDEGKLGVLLTGAYSERTLRNDTYSAAGFYDEAEGVTEATIPVDMNNDGAINQTNELFPSKVPAYMYYANAQDVRERLGGTLNVQYQPTDWIDLSADVLYSRYNTNGNRYQIGFVNYDESWTPGTPIFGNAKFGEDGRVISVTQTANPMVELLNLTTPRKTDTWQFGSNAKFQLNEQLALTADYSHSEAKDQNAGDNRFIVARGFVDSISIDYSKNNKLPDVSIAPGLNSEQKYGAHYSYNSGTGVTDKVDDLKLLATYTVDDSIITKIDAGVTYVQQTKARSEFSSRNPSQFSNGGFYLTRDKYSFDNSTVFNQGDFSLFRIPTDVFVGANFDKFLDGEAGLHPTPWPSFDYDKLLAYYRSINAEAADKSIVPQLNQAGAFNVKEAISTAFIQMNIEDTLFDMPYFLNLGLRGSKTEVTSSGFSYDLAKVVLDANGKPINNDWRTVQQLSYEGDYSKLLPSLNFKLTLLEDLFFRFSAAEVMSRPSLDQLKPWVAPNFTTFKEGLPQLSINFPDLPPEMAKQYDATLEWYFADSSQLAAGVFVKDIQSFISTARGPVELHGVNYYAEYPISGEYGASIKGAEFSWQQSMENWLPVPFDGLGFQLNYTYVDSEFEDPELADLSYTGMSKNSYNAVVYYEKDGIQARLAYNWRSKFLLYPGDWGGDSWIADYGQLDASASYDINDQLSVYTEVSNLTNQRYWGYVKQEDQVNFLERFGTQLAVGIRGNF
ncbi:TonB-dependent receptor [Rheinheimera sp. SA_1]|uniref:TonB-dependent receptor n=1 Tax=Rheinheimera sp. SA_1 TaxID=1827365 RepID=UPI000ADE3B00|nr:TonB-dependent receptor [Rheinheimera sp. SA_1]